MGPIKYKCIMCDMTHLIPRNNTFNKVCDCGNIIWRHSDKGEVLWNNTSALIKQEEQRKSLALKNKPVSTSSGESAFETLVPFFLKGFVILAVVLLVPYLWGKYVEGDKELSTSSRQYVINNAKQPLLNDTIISADTTNYQQAQTQPKSIEQPKAAALQEQREIVDFRIQNSLVNTDKSLPCHIIIDEQKVMMTLEALNGVDKFTLTRERSGVFIFNYYDNEGLQATKRVYRRGDLEDESDAQIYTSRTGEITITLSYP